MDKEYVEKHLQGYIEFQLKQGYLLKDVWKALLKYGYDEILVKEICSMIDESAFTPSKERLKIKDLNEDLFVYLQNLLVDFIKKEQEQGYTIEVIEKALINYGHHPSMVKQAIRSVKNGKITDLHKTIKMGTGLVLLVTLILIIGFVFFLVKETDASLNIVILCFSPVFVSTLLAYTFVQNADHKLIKMIPIAAVVIIVIMYVIMIQMIPTMKTVSEPQTVLLLNVFLGFVTSSLIAFFTKPKPELVSIEDIATPIIFDEKKLEERVEMMHPEPTKTQIKDGKKTKRGVKKKLKIKKFSA